MCLTFGYILFFILHSTSYPCESQLFSSFLYRAVYTRSINLLKRRKISSGYIQQLDDINSKLLETL